MSIERLELQILFTLQPWRRARLLSVKVSYCPLTWMLHSMTLNNRINNIHERALRLTYKDDKSSFKQLLEKDHSVTVHQKNLQVLVTKIF